MPWTPYADLDELIEELLGHWRRILGDRLAGAWIQGSFAVGAGDLYSDCDWIVATHAPLTEEQVAALRRLHDEIPTHEVTGRTTSRVRTPRSPDRRTLVTGSAEVYAGFLEHVDHHIGRLVEAIDDLGVLDNTIVYYIVGDNGASAEGTLNGAFNEMAARLVSIARWFVDEPRAHENGVAVSRPLSGPGTQMWSRGPGRGNRSVVRCAAAVGEGVCRVESFTRTGRVPAGVRR